MKPALALALLAASAASSMLLNACRTAGPEFSKPATPAVSAFKNTSSTESLTKEASSEVPALPADGAWWTVLKDEELNRLEVDAFANSPSIALVAARVGEARARLGIAQADRRPGLSTTDTARLLGESSQRTLPLPGHPVTYRDAGDSYRLSLDASYEPDLWGRIRRLTESANAQLEAGEADLRAAKLVLSADLATSYTTLRGLELELDVLRRTRLLRADNIEILIARHKAGLAPETDVYRARAELASLDAEQADLMRRRENTRNALALLCGHSVSEISLQSVGTLPAVPIVPAGIPADVLRRRPDLASAEALLHARTAEIGVAEAARYPTIRLTAGGGFESGDLLQLLDRPSQFWQLGPSLSFPILDGGRTRANIEVAKARVEGARADHRQKCLTALKEVEDALVDLRLSAEQATALEQGRQASTQALSLLKTRYEAGLITYLEVSDAERSLLQFERSQAQNQSSRLLATIRLVRSLGGGW